MKKRAIVRVPLEVYNRHAVLHVQIERCHRVVHYNHLTQISIELKDLEVFEVHLLFFEEDALLVAKDIGEETTTQSIVHGPKHLKGIPNIRLRPTSILIICSIIEEVRVLVLAFPVHIMNNLTKSLGILDGPDGEYHDLEVRVKFDEHLEEIGAEAQVHCHRSLIRHRLLSFHLDLSRQHRPLRLLVKGTVRGQHERLIDIKHYGFLFYIIMFYFIDNFLLKVLFS